MRDPGIELNIGSEARPLDRPVGGMQKEPPERERAGPRARPFRRLQLPWCYQEPPLWAEHPPLSAEPVWQPRVVVPFAARTSEKIAAFESRLDVTVTV